MRLDNLTFKGGVLVKDRKDFTRDKAIEKAGEPSIVRIPLQQHVGAPCKALVKKGDKVKSDKNWRLRSYSVCTSSLQRFRRSYRYRKTI